MSTDPFEEKLRDLPWRKPTDNLRTRLFPPKEENIVRGSFLSRIPLGWAALILVGVGLSSYTLWPTTEQTTAETPTRAPQADLNPMVIASTQDFFDFSSRADDVWAGPLTLKVEPN